MFLLLNLILQFESYVKVAHSKATLKTNNRIKMFESYVKVAHSKAVADNDTSLFMFESYVKVAHSKANLSELIKWVSLRAM